MRSTCDSKVGENVGYLTTKNLAWLSTPCRPSPVAHQPSNNPNKRIFHHRFSTFLHATLDATANEIKSKRPRLPNNQKSQANPPPRLSLNRSNHNLLMSTVTAPLSLFRSLLREARKVDNYNFREHAIRRVRVGFQMNRNLSG